MRAAAIIALGRVHSQACKPLFQVLRRSQALPNGGNAPAYLLEQNALQVAPGQRIAQTGIKALHNLLAYAFRVIALCDIRLRLKRDPTINEIDWAPDAVRSPGSDILQLACLGAFAEQELG